MAENEKKEIREEIEKLGQIEVKNGKYRIHIMTVIGEIEGHECLNSNTKTTKYEHVLPELARIEESEDIDGILVLINSVGGDVESGLAISEMLASIDKPVVTLVLGGSHSIAVPLAVSGDYSFIVPTGTMVIHPVRMNGLFIGASQTYDYFKKIQDRITEFICTHCEIKEERLYQLMMETEELTKDIGSILVGKETVKEGIIQEVGGIHSAFLKLHEIIEERMEKRK